MQTHNPVEWLKQFNKARQNGHGFRELRKLIYEQTFVAVMNKGYVVNDKTVHLDSSSKSQFSEFIYKPIVLPNNEEKIGNNKVSVIEADCIETARLLSNAGFNVCMLNMANRRNPGGGVMNGAGAQEENIFRRSNLLTSLYCYAPYAKDYGLLKDSLFSYPLDKNYGAIYSPNVTIFRSSENTGYQFLENPFDLAIVSVAAMNNPELVSIDNQLFIAPHLEDGVLNKIRTILRVGAKYNHDCLVLSAFGCGAFQNPPHHIAQLFKSVLNEFEFYGRFKLIVFAIIDDHNSRKEHNPDGNVIPFLKTFNV